MENLVSPLVIIALIKALKERFPQVTGDITILIAILLGVLGGYLGFEGLTIQSGIIAGLSAVGIHTVAGRVSTAK